MQARCFGMVFFSFYATAFLGWNGELGFRDGSVTLIFAQNWVGFFMVWLVWAQCAQEVACGFLGCSCSLNGLVSLRPCRKSMCLDLQFRVRLITWTIFCSKFCVKVFYELCLRGAFCSNSYGNEDMEGGLLWTWWVIARILRFVDRFFLVWVCSHWLRWILDMILCS